MNTDLLHYIILSGAYIVLFATAEILYHKFKIQAEYSRKVVHIGSGLLTMLFPILFSSHWWVLGICSSFVLLLFVSQKYNFLRSINAINRKSHGSILYPVAVYMSFLSYNYMCEKTGVQSYFWFYQPVLVMALADPAAAIFGKKFPKGVMHINNDKKTVTGFVSFIIVSFFVTGILVHLLNAPIVGAHLYFLLVVSISTAVTELFTTKGSDNIFIPLVAILINYFWVFNLAA